MSEQYRDIRKEVNLTADELKQILPNKRLKVV
ncbi:Tn5252, Orf 10 protein [Streptococcus pneumoniae]|nr:Tn5252, Orf 10 protein [Streptococcus pneumoniae]VIZ59553.1 Tn5252, Orf 10 protein [Streptococcus pneumoniae]VQD11418.1 Tn5252, Orf 10 protein [Streptococcus pneumoniae]VQG55908.1 Tn5252, Orf 10 protein [Streptococcus pneumoniae]VQU80095.1 Tn5252, Orf 10 protein [Streptococcus pneumoniae]